MQTNHGLIHFVYGDDLTSLTALNASLKTILLSVILAYGSNSQTVLRDYKGVREQLKGGRGCIYLFNLIFPQTR